MKPPRTPRSHARDFLYRKIAADLRAKLRSGAIAPGARLPSLNEIAAAWGANRLTAMKAVEELRAAGLVVSVRAQGTFAAKREEPGAPAERAFTIGLLSRVLHPAGYGLYHQAMIAGLYDGLGPIGANLLVLAAGAEKPSELPAMMRRARADAIAALYEARKFSQVPVEVCKLADAANEYFDRHAPWKAIKEDPEAVRPVLTTVLNLFRLLAIYLAPILPVYAKKAAALFGEDGFTWESLGRTLENAPIGAYEYLATRVDPKAVEAMVEASKPPALPAAEPGKYAGPQHGPSANPAAGEAAPAAQSGTDRAVGGHICPPDRPPKAPIQIGAFDACDLRVGTVLSCTAVPKSKKLVRFELDCGPLGHRTIFSGIRSAYPDPSVLDGRQVVFVANLAPREMKGVGVSEGMVLCAGDPATGLAVLAPLAPVNPGDPAT